MVDVLVLFDLDSSDLPAEGSELLLGGCGAFQAWFQRALGGFTGICGGRVDLYGCIYRQVDILHGLGMDVRLGLSRNHRG